MARAGVTYDEVAQAATQLTEQGKSVTIEAVRAKLHTGSNTTLSKHLNQWRQHHRGVTKSEQGLPETLINAVKGLHQAMTEEANSKIETLDAEHANALNAVKSELTLLQQQYNQALQTNRQLEQDKAQGIEEKAALERHIEAQKDVSQQQEQEIHLLNERLNDKKADIESLQQQLKHAQTNLEHYREATRQEREQERLSFESKVTQLECALRESQTESTENRVTIDKLKERQDELKGELKSHAGALKESEAKQHQLNLTYGMQVKQHQQLQGQYDALKTEVESHQAKSEADKNQLQTLLLKLAQGEERTKGLQQALDKAEDRITALTDKNLFLIQEKTELSIQVSQLSKPMSESL